MSALEPGDYAGDFQALATLAEAFTQLVDALCAHDDAEAAADDDDPGGSGGLSPQAVVDLARRSMPHAHHVSLAAEVDGAVHDLAATSNVPCRIDQIRTDTGQGPAFDVLGVNDFVISGNMADDPRWPRYGRRVVHETDVTSVVSYRLYLGRGRRAALSFYSEWPEAFDDLAISIGAIFAAYASVVSLQSVLGNAPADAARRTCTSRWAWLSASWSPRPT